MTTIAYIYSDPILDTSTDESIWGVEVDLVYQDLGKRHQLEQLLADCQVNPPQYLLIRRLEELGDSILEIGDRLTQIEALGITIIATQQSYSSSQLNDSAPQDIRANLTKLLAEIEASQKSRRLRQGHARNRLKALPPPGKAPYGYRRGQDKYIVDRSTAPVVKDFFARFILYGSLRGAVRYLEKRYGKKIAPSTGRNWLINPVYRGNLAYGNGDVIPNTHAAIMSKEEAAQIDRLLRRNRPLPPRTASAPRSLAGLTVCHQCQSTFKVAKVTTYKKKREYLYLRPLNCPLQKKCSAIAYEEVLQQTIERICTDLPPAVAKLGSSNIDGLKALLQEEINGKKAIIQQLPQLEQDGILDGETAQLRGYKLKVEIAALEGKIAQLPPVNLMAIAQTVSIPQFWLDLSEAERRFYFREFIRQIEISRTGSKDWQLELIFIF